MLVVYIQVCACSVSRCLSVISGIHADVMNAKHEFGDLSDFVVFSDTSTSRQSDVRRQTTSFESFFVRQHSFSFIVTDKDNINDVFISMIWYH